MRQNDHFWSPSCKITCTFLKWKSSSVRAIAEPVIRKPAPPTIEECKAAVVAGNPPPAPPVPGKPKAPEGTPVITPLSKGHGQQRHGKNEVRDDAGLGRKD